MISSRSYLRCRASTLKLLLQESPFLFGFPSSSYCEAGYSTRVWNSFVLLHSKFHNNNIWFVGSSFKVVSFPPTALSHHCHNNTENIRVLEFINNQKKCRKHHFFLPKCFSQKIKFLGESIIYWSLFTYIVR